MNAVDRFERELTAWFVDAAAARMPDDIDLIARRATQVHQRPGWSFPGQWLPSGIDHLSVRGRWRLAALLMTVALLVGLAAVATIGSRKSLPAPFGLAANGLVAYSQGGDILTVDPTTGVRRALVTGPELDIHPRWSPDGTRLAFLREERGRPQLVIVDADGRGPAIVATTPLERVDDDGIRWSPDGRSIALTASVHGLPAIVLVDTLDGRQTTLDIEYSELEVFWRPPDGRELLFVGGFGLSRRGLYLLSMDDGSVRRIPMPVPEGGELRPMGWTPDGARVVIHRLARPDTYRTFLVDADTGAEVEMDVVFGHLSNGGDRIAGFVPGTELSELCVGEIGAGPCRSIASGPVLPDGTHFEGIRWSPDDAWIVAMPMDGRPSLLDPARASPARPAWIADGADSWQRLAP